MKIIEPALNQANALIIEDESQRSSPYPTLATRGEPITMQVGQRLSVRGEPNAKHVSRGQPYKGIKSFMKCDYRIKWSVEGELL